MTSIHQLIPGSEPILTFNPLKLMSAGLKGTVFFMCTRSKVSIYCLAPVTGITAVIFLYTIHRTLGFQVMKNTIRDSPIKAYLISSAQQFKTVRTTEVVRKATLQIGLENWPDRKALTPQPEQPARMLHVPIRHRKQAFMVSYLGLHRAESDQTEALDAAGISSNSVSAWDVTIRADATSTFRY